MRNVERDEMQRKLMSSLPSCSLFFCFFNFHFLVILPSVWDLSYPTRDQT